MSSIDRVSSAVPQYDAQSTRANGMKNVDDTMAKLLGMSSDDLKTAEKNGSTLNDLAKQKGISQDTLHTALTQALQKNAPANSPTNIDFSQMATNIAAGKGPGGGGRPPMPAQGSGENNSNGSLESLLQQYGIDSTSLLKLLQTNGSSSSSSASSSSDSSQTDDFTSKLKALIDQYGSKGNAYDSQM